MGALVKAELVKGRRSFGRKAVIVIPFVVVVMATILTGGRLVQVGAANWWYTVLMPAAIALICVNLIGPEKKQAFFNVSALPLPKTKVWWAKVLVGCGYLFLANLIVFGLTFLVSLLFGVNQSFASGITAALVLTATCVWQIPVGMLLATRFNTAFTLVIMLVLNFMFSMQPFAGTSLWMIPWAIPARLMAPILSVNPNGVPLHAGDALLDPGVILPGLAIAAVLFGAVGVLASVWFSRKEN